MIIKAFKTTLDYCLFTLGFILAVQLPEFIQQYQQYMAGKLTEAQWHLKSYQAIADQQYDGSLPILINEYLTNGSEAIKQTGLLISDLANRVDLLSEQVTTLNGGSYIDKVWFFVTNIQIPDAQVVMSYYQLAIPLTIEALVSGGALAFIFIWLRLLLTYLLHRLFGISKKPNFD